MDLGFPEPELDDNNNDDHLFRTPNLTPPSPRNFNSNNSHHSHHSNHSHHSQHQSHHNNLPIFDMDDCMAMSEEQQLIYMHNTAVPEQERNPPRSRSRKRRRASPSSPVPTQTTSNPLRKKMKLMENKIDRYGKQQKQKTMNDNQHFIKMDNFMDYQNLTNKENNVHINNLLDTSFQNYRTGFSNTKNLKIYKKEYELLRDSHVLHKMKSTKKMNETKEIQKNHGKNITKLQIENAELRTKQSINKTESEQKINANTNTLNTLKEKVEFLDGHHHDFLTDNKESKKIQIQKFEAEQKLNENRYNELKHDMNVIRNERKEETSNCDEEMINKIIMEHGTEFASEFASKNKEYIKKTIAISSGANQQFTMDHIRKERECRIKTAAETESKYDLKFADFQNQINESNATRKREMAELKEMMDEKLQQHQNTQQQHKLEQDEKIKKLDDNLSHFKADQTSKNQKYDKYENRMDEIESKVTKNYEIIMNIKDGSAHFTKLQNKKNGTKQSKPLSVSDALNTLSTNEKIIKMGSGKGGKNGKFFDFLHKQTCLIKNVVTTQGSNAEHLDISVKKNVHIYKISIYPESGTVSPQQNICLDTMKNKAPSIYAEIGRYHILRNTGSKPIQYKVETNDNLDSYHRKWRLFATIFYTNVILDENKRKIYLGFFDIINNKK